MLSQALTLFTIWGYKRKRWGNQLGDADTVFIASLIDWRYLPFLLSWIWGSRGVRVESFHVVLCS